MSDVAEARVGSIGWVDLTVKDAESLRAFYSDVVGWASDAHDMGEYADFVMNEPKSGTATAGICHARGVNADAPAQWIVYITVEDLDASLEQCRRLGGTVLGEPRGADGQGRFCLIRDPAGAVCALYQLQST